ncbi:helix-turn-helix transcriptional regulator [Marinobacter sp.]|uniref:helix-turn-helix transcriptional regulator n=1 Tax=Marinobacter sp. TaxID=50741 RepID=UPI003A936B92
MHREPYDTHLLTIDSDGQLSPKEEIEAAAICLGRSTKQSAKLRAVSPETCKSQRTAAKAKVGASNQCEFVLTLVARGWLTLDGTPRFSRLHKDHDTMDYLTELFHCTQARLRSQPSRTGTPGVIDARFFGPGPGEGAFYDVPALWRQKAVRTDFDNQCRLAQYTDRVRATLQAAA